MDSVLNKVSIHPSIEQLILFKVHINLRKIKYLYFRCKSEQKCITGKKFPKRVKKEQNVEKRFLSYSVNFARRKCNKIC